MFESIVDKTRRLLRERTANWSLEQPFRVDRGLFDLEMEVLSKRQWLFVWAAANEQDKRLAENNQPGIRGGADRPGPYSELIADGTRALIRWYVEERVSALAPLTAAP